MTSATKATIATSANGVIAATEVAITTIATSNGGTTINIAVTKATNTTTATSTNGVTTVTGILIPLLLLLQM